MAEPLCRAIRNLYYMAGSPPARWLTYQTGIGHSTCLFIAKGERISSWDYTSRIIEVLGGKPQGFKEMWEQARHRPYRQGRDDDHAMELEILHMEMKSLHQKMDMIISWLEKGKV